VDHALFSSQGAAPTGMIIRSAGLQFGLQFTLVQPGSSEYAHTVYAAARTPMNPCERVPLKLLIRGVGLHWPEIWPYNTAKHRLTMRTSER
jgi:hypothetical protein